MTITTLNLVSPAFVEALVSPVCNRCSCWRVLFSKSPAPISAKQPFQQMPRFKRVVPLVVFDVDLPRNTFTKDLSPKMQPNTEKQKSSKPREHTMQATYSIQHFLPSQFQQHLSPSQYPREYVPEAMSSSWGMPTSMPDTMGFNVMGYSRASTQDYDNGLPFENLLDSQKALSGQPASYHTGIPHQQTQHMDYHQASPYFENSSMPRSRQAECAGAERTSRTSMPDWSNVDFQVDWSHVSKSWETPQGMLQNAFNSSIMSSPMTGNESAPSECGRSSIDIDVERHRSPSVSVTSTKIEKPRNASRSKISHRLSTSSRRSKGEKSQSKSRDEQHYQCPVGGCTKKFARKTDLERHNKSVHIKERNHECTFCGRLFARKDTLRRY